MRVLSEPSQARARAWAPMGLLLVLACGALPLTPAYAQDSSGNLQPGICHFRNWQDLATLRLAGQQLQHAVVVGGGFLGLEAAEGLRKLGMQVSLLQRGAYLLNRQLDATAATLLQQQLSSRGLNILTNSEIERLNYKHGQLQSVRLTSGQQLKADIVVLALGIRPNISLAQQSGLSVKHGIIVNRNLQSSDSAIYALGECIELNGETFGLVAPINAQATQLAQTLCGKATSYCSENTATQLKISGIALSSCGDIATLCASADSFDGCTDYLDSELNEYRRLWWRGPYLVGAVLYGDTRLSQQLSLRLQHRFLCFLMPRHMQLHNFILLPPLANVHLTLLPQNLTRCSCRHSSWVSDDVRIRAMNENSEEQVSVWA